MDRRDHQTSDEIVGLASTELARRPTRPPDHAVESRTLVALSRQLASSPVTILQQLADTSLELCRAHSAGFSLLSDDREHFTWAAISGAWARHLGGGTPREFGPCGMVLDRDAALLFWHPERRFPYLADAPPAIDEGLLLPFHVDGRAVGTIWVISHDPSRRFDAEDLRVMTSLATFSSAAYQARRDSEHSLAKQNARLRMLWEATAIVLTTDEPDAMLRALFDTIRGSLGLDAYLGFMLAEDGTELALVSCAGLSPDDAREVQRLALGEGVSGLVAQSRTPLVCADVQRSTEPRSAFARRIGLQAFACAPLLARDRLLGTLAYGSRTRGAFERDEIEFLQTVTQYVAIAYERLRLVAQLRDQDRRKDEFLATLAHELRNPLAPIANGLQLIERAGDRPGTLAQARAMIERQLEHMVRLVDDLLDVSRISRDKLELRRQPVELAAIVQSAIETSRPVIDKAAHRLEIELPPAPVVLDADPVRLAQAISNLLSNAAKYSEPGRSIRIAAACERGEVVLRVRDQGIGIPADQLERIFEAFVQVDRSLDRSAGGLGIGLTLVKRIVEMHGGRVGAQSDGPDRGSELALYLPCVAEPAAAEVPPRADGALPAVRRRVLIVDDNLDAAQSLAEILELLGHEVAMAHDGLEALELATEFRPEVAVLDIGMPRLDGYELARRLRARFASAPPLLIAMTGWGQDSDRLRSREAGFDLHLVKPVKPSLLESLIRGDQRA